jgi:5,10-methylenetetrahydromethanopterin reductase
MKIDVTLGAPKCNLETLMNLARLAERYGFDTVWSGDAAYERDYVVGMTHVAQATKKVGVGLAVTNPYLRHPIKTALAVASINEVSGGRAKFGIGAGSLETLRSLGLDWVRPAQRIAEMINVSRDFLRGETVNYVTDTITVSEVKAWMTLMGPIPFYVGCRRPVMLRMAGKTADGVLMDNVPVEYLPYAMDRIRKGAESAGKEIEKFDVGNLNMFAVSEDRTEARRRAKRLLPMVFITITERELEAIGLTKRDVEPIQTVIRRQTAEDFAKASSLVTDYMVDKVATCGTPEDCVKRIRDYGKAGVTRMVLELPTEPVYKPEEILKLAGEAIIPEFAE